MDAPILEVHAKCVSSFIEVVSAISNPSRDFRDQTPLMLEKTLENFDRYKLWAGNVGLVNFGERYQDPLDDHFEERCFYTAQVLKLLENLDKTIQKALSLIQGARKPFEECSPLNPKPYPNQVASSDDGSDEQSDADDSTWEISSISDDEEDDGDSDEFTDKNYLKAAEASDTSPSTRLTTTNSQEYSQFMLLVQKPNKEMPQLLESINFVISCLYQLPFLRVAPHNRFTPINLSMVATSHDREYIKRIFPHLGPKVATRIGKIISCHRLQFRNLPLREVQECLEFLYSQSEFDPLPMRQIPEAGTDRNEHFITKIHPFVCTYEDCDMLDLIFESCDEWYKHEIQTHRVKWFCNVEGHLSYAKQSEFSAHMKRDHDTRLNVSQMSLLISMFQRPTRSRARNCNLCSVYPSELKSHVSCHLKEIAQFALLAAERAIGREIVKLHSQGEQSLPIGIHGLRLEEPGIDDSIKEVFGNFVNPVYRRGQTKSCNNCRTRRIRCKHDELGNDLRLKEPGTDDSTKEAVVRDMEDFLDEFLVSIKRSKAKKRGGFEVAPELKHKTAFTSPLIFGPGPPLESGKVGEMKNMLEHDLSLPKGPSAEERQAIKPVHGGHIVENINKKAADQSAQSMEFRSALLKASMNGHESTVKLLLKNGSNVNVNAQGSYDSSNRAALRDFPILSGEYGNALQAALANGHEQVVGLLLENGADVNAQGGIYGNALQTASAKGHRSMMELLLENGAVVNAQGGIYGNALQAASASGHKRTVEVLLKNGADVNAQGVHGSALQAVLASSYERNLSNDRKDILKLLLACGADVNAKGGPYGSALRAALARGYMGAVELLLENWAVDENDEGNEEKINERKGGEGASKRKTEKETPRSQRGDERIKRQDREYY